MICGIAVLLVLILFGRFARYIPYAVLAGILMVTSSRMVDRWSFKLVKQKSTLRDMAIVIIVAGTTVFISLMVAVGVGVLITMIMFIHDQVKRSVIKNKIYGNQIHSKKVRSLEEMEHLNREGHCILVYQLDGSLFFGTADGLMQEIEHEKQEASIIILDFRLVKEIDLTGVQILRQLYDQLQEQGKQLVLSYVQLNGDKQQTRVAALLKDVNVLELIGNDRVFADTDRALEWAEDYLLYEHLRISVSGERSVDLKRMKIFQYLSEAEIEKIAPLLNFQRYNANEIIFEEGDEGNAMFLVSRGCVSILLALDGGHRQKRIASFGEGVFFGDMALLEEKPRSATAIAEKDTELYSLSRDNFIRMLKSDATIASKIQLGIARELSARLRSTSDELRALEI